MSTDKGLLTDTQENNIKYFSLLTTHGTRRDVMNPNKNNNNLKLLIVYALF